MFCQHDRLHVFRLLSVAIDADGSNVPANGATAYRTGRAYRYQPGRLVSCPDPA